MKLTCTARQSGQQLIVTVAGDVDLAIYPRLRTEAQTWADNGTDVVMDCSGVTFMDSMGIRVLIQLRRAITDAGHTLALVGPSQPVVRVLELAGIQDLFEQAARPQADDETTS
ncbi:anti-sigma factor antagonist [Catenulispora yoronensis]|uniref:Anti-sigma factor antagonist n=1 Tax=Catenulispora yoronensis TaxID=450799 RepID=A0ABP5FCX6_9ACTN